MTTERIEVTRTIAADLRLAGNRPAVACGRLTTGRKSTHSGVRPTYDWPEIDPQWRAAGIFPVISEGALRVTLGILARTVARSWPGPSAAIS